MYIRDLKMAKSCGKIMRKWDHVAKFVGVSQQRSICGLRAMWHDRLHDICMQHANKQANKTQTFNITINVNHRLVSLWITKSSHFHVFFLFLFLIFISIARTSFKSSKYPFVPFGWLIWILLSSFCFGCADIIRPSRP